MTTTALLTPAQRRAVEHFDVHTTMRRSPQREAVRAKIAASPQPLRKAKEFLELRGSRPANVGAMEFLEDMEKVRASHGPFDPVFRERIAQARQRVKAGAWTRAEHVQLLAMLRDAWQPWADEDRREFRGAVAPHHAEMREAVRHDQ